MGLETGSCFLGAVAASELSESDDELEEDSIGLEAGTDLPAAGLDVGAVTFAFSASGALAGLVTAFSAGLSAF